MTPTQILITTLILQSERLLSLAEIDQWDDFSVLELERQRHLKQLDLAELSLAEQASIDLRNNVQALMNLNDRLEVTCRKKRKNIAADIEKINQGNKAKKAYT